MRMNGRLTVMLMGAVAGAVGTAAMDLAEFSRYRRDGGTQAFPEWESATDVDNWSDASAPGQFGKAVVERLTGRDLADRWARPMTNLVHWATGIGWGTQFGLLVAASPRHRRAVARLFGPAVWLSSYAILPLAKVYKPIWEYDAATLGKDLGAHLVYGRVTASTFAALERSLSSP
jgi:hypothetical protein